MCVCNKQFHRCLERDTNVNLRPTWLLRRGGVESALIIALDRMEHDCVRGKLLQIRKSDEHAKAKEKLHYYRDSFLPMLQLNNRNGQEEETRRIRLRLLKERAELAMLLVSRTPACDVDTLEHLARMGADIRVAGSGEALLHLSRKIHRRGNAGSRASILQRLGVNVS